MQARTPVPPRTGTAGPAHLVGEGVPDDGAVAGAGVQAARPGAQPPRGAGGSRRAQGNALSPERLMAHQPGRNGPRQGREAGILGSSSPEQRVRELADPNPSLNNMQARALLGTGKAQSLRFGNHSCALSTGSIGRALSTGTRRGATPRIGADWPNQDQDQGVFMVLNIFHYMITVWKTFAEHGELP